MLSLSQTTTSTKSLVDPEKNVQASKVQSDLAKRFCEYDILLVNNTFFINSKPWLHWANFYINYNQPPIPPKIPSVLQKR
jgi:hypothetical protein